MNKTYKSVMQSIPALIVFFCMFGFQLITGVANQPQHIIFNLMVLFGLTGFLFISILSDQLNEKVVI